MCIILAEFNQLHSKANIKIRLRWTYCYQTTPIQYCNRYTCYEQTQRINFNNNINIIIIDFFQTKQNKPIYIFIYFFPWSVSSTQVTEHFNVKLDMHMGSDTTNYIPYHSACPGGYRVHVSE